DGSRVAIGRGEYVTTCLGDWGLYSVTALDILDTRSGSIERFAQQGEGVIPAYWAPDGSGFIFQSGQAHEQGQPVDCPGTSAPLEWKLWTTAGVQAVFDLDAVVGGWYGGDFVELECDGVLLESDWPLELRSISCDSSTDPPPGTLIIGGERIDTIRRAAIVGFID
ncbi:MAG TPA: hypothetical protein VIH05_01440, partial [Tepidiformaceae bacterium]